MSPRPESRRGVPPMIALAATVVGTVVGILIGFAWPAAGTSRAPTPTPPAGAVRATVPSVAVRAPSVNRPKLSAAVSPAAIWTEATERTAADALAEWAARDPAAAWQRALAEPNWRVRTRLCDAVLRGWAGRDPRAALGEALRGSEEHRAESVAAVFSGASADPSVLIDLARAATRADPDRAYEFTRAAAAALGERGAFAEALALVTSGPVSPQQQEQAGAVFQSWAEHAPAAAAAALDSVATPELREAAFRGLVVGWAAANPVTLAEYAATLPSGEARATAVANALPAWLARDPVAAAAWLGEHDLGADADAGVAAVANTPELLSGRPELSLQLAQGITDPALRANTLRTLALRWGAKDRAAAARFVSSSAAFADAERNEILEEIAPQ